MNRTGNSIKDIVMSELLLSKGIWNFYHNNKEAKKLKEYSFDGWLHFLKWEQRYFIISHKSILK